MNSYTLETISMKNNPSVKAESSVRAQIIEHRTYLRPLNEEGTIFETSEQAFQRVIKHQRWLWQRAKAGMVKDDRGEWILNDLTSIEEAELSEMYKLFIERKATLSGRTRWLGGTELSKRRESASFNCAFTKVHTVSDAVDAFWLLLQGCGVGFRPSTGVLNGFNNEMTVEIIRSKRTGKGGHDDNFEHFNKVDGIWTIAIGDSAEAWAKSLGKILAGKYPAKRLVIDMSQIRPGGVRLSGYGWISSGDGPLAKAYIGIAEIMNRKAGHLLSKIDILDIINWLGTVLSSRRAAEAAVVRHGSIEWEEFTTAKLNAFPDKFWRGQSNNSILAYEKLSHEELTRLFQMMVDSGGSEPGIVNAKQAIIRAPWFKGFNPCFEIFLPSGGFCVDGRTKLITQEGITKIKDSVGKEIKIWNGNRWAPVTPFKTNNAVKLYRVSFADGSYLDVTENHRFFVTDRFGTEYKEVLTKDLMQSKYLLHTEPFSINLGDSGILVDNAYTIGFYVGDGNENRLDVYGKRKQELPLTYKAKVEYKKLDKWRLSGLPFDWRWATKLKTDLSPVFSWNRESIIAFISGLADADGSNTSSGAIRIYQGNEIFCRDLQLLLTKVGIQSSINFMTDKPSNFGIRNKPMWYVQITDVTKMRTNRLSHNYTGNKRGKGKWQNIRSVKLLEGLHEAFCFTEPETSKGVFGNSLTGQCNLVETMLPQFNGNFDALKRAHWLISRANYRQTCVDLHDGILQDVWHEANEYLRLCGVGVTGIVSWEGVNNPKMQRKLRATAQEGVDSMADDLMMPRSKAVTTIKPSGTQSKVSGLVGQEVPEGLHKPLGRYIFNKVRFSKADPIVAKLKVANYEIMDDPTNAEVDVIITLPVEFTNIDFETVEIDTDVCHCGNNVKGHEFFDGHGPVPMTEFIEINTEPAIDQLERYKMWMENYVDHNASITVYYSIDEVTDIVNWLYDNWDSFVAVAFLPKVDPTMSAKDLGYPYLPQEAVSASVYYDYVRKLLPVDLTNTDSLLEIDVGEECATGACPIR